MYTATTEYLRLVTRIVYKKTPAMRCFRCESIPIFINLKRGRFSENGINFRILQALHIIFATFCQIIRRSLLSMCMNEKPKVHYSSASVEWSTPQWLFDSLDREFGFELDVCSTDQNAKCKNHFTIEDDGLSKSWANKNCWMNPPYGKEIKKWMKKAHYESLQNGALVVCLVPARTDTAWWHCYAMKHEVRLIRGRLKFGDISGDFTKCAPFPSAIVVMRPADFSLFRFGEKR